MCHTALKSDDPLDSIYQEASRCLPPDAPESQLAGALTNLLDMERRKVPQVRVEDRDWWNIWPVPGEPDTVCLACYGKDSGRFRVEIIISRHQLKNLLRDLVEYWTDDPEAFEILRLNEV